MQWDRYSVWERININCLINWRITVVLHSDRTLKSPMYTDVRTSQCNGKTKAFISNLLLPLKKSKCYHFLYLKIYPCATFRIFLSTGAKFVTESRIVLYCSDDETSELTIAFVFCCVSLSSFFQIWDLRTDCADGIYVKLFYLTFLAFYAMHSQLLL